MRGRNILRFAQCERRAVMKDNDNDNDKADLGKCNDKKEEGGHHADDNVNLIFAWFFFQIHMPASLQKFAQRIGRPSWSTRDDC